MEIEIFFLLLSLMFVGELQTLWYNFGSQHDFDDTTVYEFQILNDGWIHEIILKYQVQTAYSANKSWLEFFLTRNSFIFESISNVDIAEAFYEDLDSSQEFLAAYMSSESDHQRVVPLEGIDGRTLMYRERLHMPVWANEILDFKMDQDSIGSDLTAGLLEFELWFKMTLAPNRWKYR